jgi:hypothetical protein
LEIFQNSTANFFHEFFEDNDGEFVIFFINDYLNIIYPKSIDRTDLHDLTVEFKYHQKPYRRFLQAIYIFLAVRWPIEKIASSGSISIFLPHEMRNSWVFIPGNHSNRVIDIKENRCFVFLKTGSNDKFISKDVSVRIDNPWLKAPKIFFKGNMWFEEERVFGIPWNRLSSIEQKNKIIVLAQNELSKLYKKTISSVTLIDYSDKLLHKILILLKSKFSLLQISDKSKVINLVKNFHSFNANFPSKILDLVESHGDFQPGNILCSKTDFWIIDWEYSYQRSIFYDALVFDLEIRFPKGLSSRFKQKVNSLDSINNYLSWTGRTFDYSNNCLFSIFFMEDLFLKLYEISGNQINKEFINLSYYLDEIVIIQNFLIERDK